MARPPKPLDPSSSGLALFGSTVRKYRTGAGETLAGLATKINYAPSTVGDVERGQSRCERDFAEGCDEVFKTDGVLTHLWDYLVKDSVYPRWFVGWPGIEEKAIALRWFELAVIPGLLQTENYARALLFDNEAAISARITRQSILTRDEPAPPLFICVICELVLWHQIAEAQVMYDQLIYLADSVSDRLSVHVVPNGLAHRGNTGAFILATMPDRSEVTYLETNARGIISSTREDVTALHESFEMIRNTALPVGQSVDLIRRTAEERWST